MTRDSTQKKMKRQNVSGPFASGRVHQEMQNTPTDVQRKLAQVLCAGSLAPIVNKGAKTAWCQATGVLCQRLHASSPLLQLGQHGNVQACIRQTAQLSTFARVCRAWREELQLYKQERVAALVARFVKISIPQALELLNISNYEPEDWTRAPDVSLLLFEVYLGSRLQFVIWLKRQRVQDSATAAQELLVSCGVRERPDGRPWRSPELCIEPHALCSKSAYDFEDADNEVYGVWHQLKQAEIQDWLVTQYTSLSAPLVI